jgi:hypothetical protein
MEDGLDLDHAILGVPATDVAALEIAERVRVLAVAKNQRILAAGLFELGSGHEPRVVEEQSFVRGGRDTKHRTHFRVRDFAAAEASLIVGTSGSLRATRT